MAKTPGVVSVFSSLLPLVTGLALAPHGAFCGPVQREFAARIQAIIADRDRESSSQRISAFSSLAWDLTPQERGCVGPREIDGLLKLFQHPEEGARKEVADLFKFLAPATKAALPELRARYELLSRRQELKDAEVRARIEQCAPEDFACAIQDLRLWDNEVERLEETIGLIDGFEAQAPMWINGTCARFQPYLHGGEARDLFVIQRSLAASECTPASFDRFPSWKYAEHDARNLAQFPASVVDLRDRIDAVIRRGGRAWDLCPVASRSEIPADLRLDQLEVVEVDKQARDYWVRMRERSNLSAPAAAGFHLPLAGGEREGPFDFRCWRDSWTY